MKKVDYPYMPENRVIQYVGIDNRFMAAAREYARLHSTDRMQPTSAIIVKNNEIIGEGANQVPIKNKTIAEWHRKGMCVRKFFKVKSGTKYWLCPGCSRSSNHAEPQAVRNAKALKNDTEGADLYHWGHWWCCKPCWDAMIGAGIKNLYLLEGSEELFRAGHSKNILGKQFK